SDDGAEFTNVTHVNATHTRIERERPAHGSVCLLLRSHGACEVLAEERRDDECMIRKPRVLDYRIDLGLAGKVRNVELAAADRFDVRQRGPDYVFDAASLAACTAAAPCLRSSVPSNEDVVTRNTPYAPLKAAARVSGRFRSASTTSSARSRCLSGLRVSARTLNWPFACRARTTAPPW